MLQPKVEPAEEGSNMAMHSTSRVRSRRPLPESDDCDGTYRSTDKLGCYELPVCCRSASGRETHQNERCNLSQMKYMFSAKESVQLRLVTLFVSLKKYAGSSDAKLCTSLRTD